MDLFLSSGLAGYAISMVLLTIGGMLAILGSRKAAGLLHRVLMVSGAIVLACAAGLGALAVAADVRDREGRRALPVEGRMIDVEGVDIHMVCAGVSAPGRPTVVWLSGGHGQGLWMAHLHKALSGDLRSCWFDRPGTGWSEPAGFPRSQSVQAAELKKTLKASGELGPFLLVGHSLGGLLAVTYGAMYPEDITGIVALDPTPPSLTLVGQNSWCITGPRYLRRLALYASFGLIDVLPALDPLGGAGTAPIRAALGEDWESLRRLEFRPSALAAAASASDTLCRRPLSMARTPGLLGDIPLRVIIAPAKPTEPASANSDIEKFEAAMAARITSDARQEVARLSTRAELVEAPSGTGHGFLYEAPDFVVEQIRAFIGGITPVAAPRAP